MDADVLVRDYLGRLEAVASSLGTDRRTELVGEVREHIDAAIGEAGRKDEVTVRNILERLGPPEEIVASEGGPSEPPASVGRPGIGGVEITALVLLTVGAIFLPIIGPIIGLVFVWASVVWTRRAKVIATAIVVVLLLPPILGLLAARGVAG